MIVRSILNPVRVRKSCKVIKVMSESLGKQARVLKCSLPIFQSFLSYHSGFYIVKYVLFFFFFDMPPKCKPA